MLSSRCDDPLSAADPTPLSTVRRRLKKAIEQETVFGRKPFEVWINEEAEALSHDADSWDVCLQQVRECDVLIVLYSGNAGWAKTAGDIGICHAEYMEGLKASRTKVRLVELPPCPASTDEGQLARNKRFATYRSSESPFRGGKVPAIESELIGEVKKALFDAVLMQTKEGGKGRGSTRADLGAALEWARLDFAKRRLAMEAEVLDALSGGTGSKREDKDDNVDATVYLPVDGRLVLVKVHAVPAAFSLAAAREPVGRPHLLDFSFAKELASAGGPLHVIACQRTVTENQATTLLGFPDATVISGSFGVYVADEIQKMQFVFLANCRDPSQTRHAVQRFMNWLEQADESRRLVDRAEARARIVKAIALEQTQPATAKLKVVKS